jgi:hypothetical protein
MATNLESDVMDDLFYEATEGPARPSAFEEMEEFEEEGFEEEGFEGEGFEEEAFEEDGFEEDDDLFEDQPVSSADAMDALEEAVADALGAEDADEFFRRLLRGVRRVGQTVGRVARRAAPALGRIARTVAPIASAIPLPWTQAIGRVASVVGRNMADEADEFEAMDDLLELAEMDDSIDAAAPVVAGLAIRRAMPNVARMPRPVRRQLVRSVSRATRTIARRQGAPAARAVPAIVRRARRAVARRGQPARAMPRVVARTAAQVARSPRLARRLARTVPARRSVALGGAPAVGTVCPRCRRRVYNLRGRVRVTIDGR